MSAKEEIKVAIVRLEKLRADSVRGPWGHWPEAGDVEIYSGNHERVVVSSVQPRSGWGKKIYVDNYEPTAELIVTLHRTIDAQLEVLRLGMPHDFPNGFSPLFHPALTLARAINRDAR